MVSSGVLTHQRLGTWGCLGKDGVLGNTQSWCFAAMKAIKR